MTNQRKNIHSMQCPECGSHNTQSVSLAHSQSVRTSANGYQSISEFGKKLEPPAPRSEFGVPFGVGYVVGVSFFFFVPEVSSWIVGWWPTGGIWLRDHPFIASGSIGAVAWLYSLASAIGFNSSVHQKEMNSWGKGIVCRRCGHRFN